jgi:hypothetical protein
VAAGTYYPTQVPDGNTIGVNGITVRDKSFHFATDMQLYGGFTGTETALSQRDWKANPTILSGDFNNAYHVLITANLTAAAIIDGFTIKGGNANGRSNVSLSYESKTFESFRGGGMSNSFSSPTITNATFTNNNANYEGGGMYNYSSSPTITNCSITNNNAPNGGGMNNYDSSPAISNATFTNNNADFGGGMYNYFSSSPTITNATFTNNNATYFGGGMDNQSSSPTITNSIIWDNGSTEVTNYNSSPIFKNSITKGSGGSGAWSSSFGTDNGGNLDLDPLFTDAANGNFTLLKCSPAINTGDDAAWTATGLSTDAAGNTRPYGTSVVDMGAYEYQGNNPFTNAIYVKHDATGDNDGSTWANAYTDLQDAIDNQCGDLAIWVAAGTYYPTQAPDGTVSNGSLDRNNAFHMAADMQLYGGFIGTETALSQRDWKANLTILSGDFNNAYHVMIIANLTAAAVIDGFTIKGGNANGSSYVSYESKRFYRYEGGGMYNHYSSPTITNATFTNNNASIFGGAIYWIGDDGDLSSTLTNCIFYSNGADHIAYDDGIEDKQPHFINCTFSGATSHAINIPYWDSGKTPVDFINCIFWDNNGDILGGDEGTDNARLNIINSIVEEAAFAPANNNINQDPLFVDAANSFLQLKCNSPAINAGTSTGAPTEDITGFTRIGIPDIGAYEYGQAVVDIQIPDGTNPSLSGIPILKANSQILNTNNVLYQGSNNVQLLPGFSVAPTGGAASVFRAEIGGGCL